VTVPVATIDASLATTTPPWRARLVLDRLARVPVGYPGRFFRQPHGAWMHSVDRGSGPAVVMVHGNPSWSFLYRGLVEPLSTNRRVLVPDHVGCGLSDLAPDGYSFQLQDRVADFTRLMDHLAPEGQVDLIVHDWGGMIGMAFAARHPERVRRIVAGNTGAFPLPAAKKLPRSLWWGRNTRIGAWLITRHNAFCKYAAKWCVTRKPLAPEVRAAYLAPYDTPAHRVAVLKFVQTIPLKPTDPGFDIVSDTAASLSKFRDTPVQLLWGMRDFVFDRHFLDEWKRYFPHAEVSTWDDCGHYLLEDAGELAIMRVWEFLNRHPLS